MNYFWKKLGPQYDENLVKEFRNENEKHGKTLDYTASEVKFKVYLATIGIGLFATHSVNLAKRQPSKFLNVRVPVSLVGVKGAVDGLLYTMSLTDLASKVVFKDKEKEKEKAMVAFNDWLKQKKVD